MVSFGENAAPETWLDHDYEETSAVFSPDGRYVAYISTQTGRPEIYIRPFPGRPGYLGAFGLATDGVYLYFTWEGTSGDLWVMDVVDE